MNMCTAPYNIKYIFTVVLFSHALTCALITQPYIIAHYKFTPQLPKLHLLIQCDMFISRSLIANDIKTTCG